MPDKDVLGKADALLRRHSIPLPGASAEGAAVPVLTELVEPPPAANAQEPPSELAQAIFERVMREVEGRLAADLERRLAQQLVPQVQAAVASAIGDLHQGLANAIGDAVAQELERRHAK